MASADIGIDLGTSSILVYTKGKGIVLKEPSVVAYDKDADKVKAIGEEARQMIGRTPGNIMAIRPLRQGVISDYTITEKMLKHFIQKAMGRKAFRKPRISICVPSGVTEVERKAVEEATYQAGAREVYIIEEPIAAAIGSSITQTFFAPAASVASLTARRSTAVTPEGMQIITLILVIKDLLVAFRINSCSMLVVTSKSAITPSLSGRTATIEPGVLPITSFASCPTQRTV